MAQQKRLKTEHAGAKNGGGYWGTRAEAKRKSNKVRRREDQRVGRLESIKSGLEAGRRL